jgi:uncharacterized coiled-coil DUF342 family protein
VSADRIERAIKRIQAAMERIDAARDSVGASVTTASVGSARVVELVNSHEKLREQVADTLRDLDELREKLEE